MSGENDNFQDDTSVGTSKVSKDALNRALREWSEEQGISDIRIQSSNGVRGSSGMESGPKYELSFRTPYGLAAQVLVEHLPKNRFPALADLTEPKMFKLLQNVEGIASSLEDMILLDTYIEHSGADKSYIATAKDVLSQNVEDVANAVMDRATEHAAAQKQGFAR